MSSLHHAIRRFSMTKLKFLCAAALLAGVTAAPGLAQARGHFHFYYGLPYPISYLHNYGPGPVPGTFAYYDGPSTVACAQSAANYIAQDRRRHPCF
jgi:hypothetical protein